MTLLERRPAETPRERISPILETERLRLRAPALEDVNAIATLANDRRIAENTTRIPHPYTRTDAEEFITSVTASDEAVFTITLTRGRLTEMCAPARNRRGEPEIGYWLGTPHWGQGYATEAVRALIDHAFDDLALDLVTAGARVSNPASRRVLEKCG